MMEMLKFHIQEMPHYEAAGARYVVVAYCGEWRDGEATNNPRMIPQLQRELRKRFMNRLAVVPAAGFSPSVNADVPFLSQPLN